MLASSNVEQRFWDRARCRRVGIALLLGLLLASAFSIFNDSTSKGFLKSGDFPGLFVSAWIYVHGPLSRLYDFSYQREIENRFWPVFNGQYYISVYPPVLAFVLAPLARFSGETARQIYSLLSLSALAIALWRLRFEARVLKRAPIFAVGLLCFYAPLFQGVLGGQNTAFSCLLVVLFLRLYKAYSGTGLKRYAFFAGVALGLWCFKPHFSLVSVLLLSLAGEFVVSLGALVVWLLAALWCQIELGQQWLADWLNALRQFSELNFVNNGPLQVSLYGAARGLCSEFASSPSIVLLICVLSLIATAALAWLVVKRLRQVRALQFGKRRAALARRAALFMIVLIPVLTPQTLYYDLGISALAVLCVLSLRKDRAVSLLLLTLLGVQTLVFYRMELGFPLLFLVGLASAVLVNRRLYRKVISGGRGANL